MWDGVANLCLHINGFRTSVRTSNERSCNKFFRLFTVITMAWGVFRNSQEPMPTQFLVLLQPRVAPFAVLAKHFGMRNADASPIFFLIRSL